MSIRKLFKNSHSLALALVSSLVSHYLLLIGSVLKKSGWALHVVARQGVDTIFNSFFGRSIRKAEQYGEMIAHVKNLKRLGQQVTVSITGEKASYTSKITAVNSEHGMVVIDHFEPFNAAELHYGRTVVIEMESYGMKMQLPCRFVEKLVPNINLGYQLKLHR